MRTTFTFSISKLFVCTLLLISSFTAVAQNKSSVSGKIIDSVSKAPIEHATVAIVNAKDTSLISYTLTLGNGDFKLSGLPSGIETRLIISAMGYGTFRQSILFKPNEVKNMGAIFLNIRTLREVVVKGERTPIIIKKDTLEFNTEAFKTRPNAVVEDLLKLLPGVQVNVDGTILVNGKEVSKVLIDGKRFFGSDPTIATKNLDAELVDKVQVYDDREEDPDHKLTDLEVGKIINLKMKKKVKKSTIGRVYAGEGTRGRYEAGGLIGNFRDTLQVSVLGLTNNLTRTGFSQAELSGAGGFSRSGGSAQYDGTFGGNGDGGIERMRSAGININNDYGEKFKVNLSYLYYNYVKDYNIKTRNDQNLDQTVLTTQNNNISQLRQDRHSTSGLIEWKPDTSHSLRLNFKLDISPTSSDANGITNSFNTQTPQISNLFTKTSSISQINEFTDYLIYYNKLKKPGSSITIVHTLDFKNSGSDDFNYNDLESFVSAVPSSLLDRYSTTIGNYYVNDLSVTLNYPFSHRISDEMFAQSRYYQTASKLSTYDKDPAGNYDDFLDDQSSNIVRNHFIENFRNTLKYTFKHSTLKVGLDLELQNINDNYHSSTPNSSNQYNYLFPSVRYDADHYSFGYYEMAMPPTVGQIQPITQQISQLSTVTGNPNLTPMHEHHLNFNYFNYVADKQTYTNLRLNASVNTNNIVQVSTKDDNGFVTSTYTNKNGGWYINGNAGKGKQFKKSKIWQFSLYNSMFASYSQQSFYFNGDNGTQHDYYISDAQNIGVSYKSIVNLNLVYRINDQITQYKGVDYASVNTLSHNVTTITSINWPKGLIFDAQYQYRYNPQIPDGFSKSSNVLNLAETVMFLKQNRAQFKLSVYDLLNQNTSVYRYASNNAITSGENEILKRYFLLTFSYKISTIKR
ncbi:TonB-dependent receptor [Mucilaginibacter sp. dw_454]|uniref:TonB-dependent receptor n=1 Tax=Mucilaginibacter sp. dw_454 TaxID=2720079 RepID=UPI001BD2459B|nr:TonB-dependent receptor [Mucilaginibacter sp. dw_454]